MYSSYLYRFSPSDRAALVEAMKDPNDCDQVYEDLVDYINVWEDADWLDDYAVERIGRWFAQHAPEPLLNRLSIFAEAGESTTRNAFREGLAL